MFAFWFWALYIIAKFFQGGYRTKMKIRSDENENQVGKFFARLRRAKKAVPKFFACGGLFFVVEALKTVKTAKNS